MHHMFDETPEEFKFSKNKAIAQLSNAIYDSHVYPVPEDAVAPAEQYNLSQYRYARVSMFAQIDSDRLSDGMGQSSRVQCGIPDDKARRTRQILQTTRPSIVGICGQRGEIQR